MSEATQNSSNGIKKTLFILFLFIATMLGLLMNKMLRFLEEVQLPEARSLIFRLVFVLKKIHTV